MPTGEPGFRRCPIDRAKEDLARRPAALQVSPDRFLTLHKDGRELITRWIERAEQTRSREPFEAYIYAWIGFNGWATCTCAQERDRVLLHRWSLMTA